MCCLESDTPLESIDDNYLVVCPYCGDVDLIFENDMPWGENDEIDVTCTKCNRSFSIRPKYEFKGFYTYQDEDYGE